MTTLLDTSALAVFLRRRTLHEQVARAVGDELTAGRGLVSVVTAAELLVGARDAVGRTRLEELIEALEVVGVDLSIGLMAGALGAYARRRGATIPLPDLLIAATALRLKLPILTIDGDFARGRRIALDEADPDAAADLWRSLQLHPASPVE